MANKSKLSKVGTVLFRGGAGCLLVTVLACVATGIYLYYVNETDAGIGMLMTIFVCYSVPIGVVAVVLGILLRILGALLRKRALGGSPFKSTDDQ